MSWRGIPEEADSKITLFAEDIINPSRKINNIFSINLPNQVHNVSAEPLSEDEFKLLLDAYNSIPNSDQNVNDPSKNIRRKTNQDYVYSITMPTL